MTINAYTPEKMDELALRFFDLASQLRGIAKIAHQFDLIDIPVHDRKALQWCENLEVWAKKTELNFKIALQESNLDNSPSLSDKKQRKNDDNEE